MVISAEGVLNIIIAVSGGGLLWLGQDIRMRLVRLESKIDQKVDESDCQDTNKRCSTVVLERVAQVDNKLMCHIHGNDGSVMIQLKKGST
jgi:hypothetical protein